MNSYKQYPAYKDSGIEWIGQIPNGWVLQKLKYISCVNLSNVDKKSQEGQPTVHLCNYTDVYYNEFIKSDLNFMEATATPEQIEKFTLKKGDVLITKDSEEWDDIAVPAYVTINYEDVLCGYHLAHIRPYEKYMDGKYLMRSFNAYPLYVQFKVSANGITRYGIGKYDIENALFILPTTNEQQTVANFLDKKTALIDGLIEKKKRQIELLKEQRQAVINQAVTKGLNSDVEMKDSGIEWLGEIPKHWEVKKLKYPAKSIVTGITPPTKEQAYFENGDVEWFTPADFKEDIRLLNSKRKINHLAVDDGKARQYERMTVMLIGIGATLGKVGISENPCCSNQQINAITFKDEYNPYFGAYYLRSISTVIVSLSNFATLPILNQSQTKDILIVVPPKDEQDEIVEFIFDAERHIENTIDKSEKQIELLQEYRTALISEAVTGKIDVREAV